MCTVTSMSLDYPPLPAWFATLVGLEHTPADDEAVALGGKRYVLDRGVLRGRVVASDRQAQTSATFGFKWLSGTFDGDIAIAITREWLLERYGDVAAERWWGDYGDAPVVLDAGCGAAVGSLALFGSFLQRVRFIAADISEAVWMAASRCAEQGVVGAFLQEDLGGLPLPEGSVHVIFSEGVLHHTDSTRDALHRLARLLTPGGRFLFYVYNKKGPVREFTDDHIRGLLQDMGPAEAWKAMEPLTRLGVALGELGIEIDVPDDIELLGIPAGRYDIQRFFYWHVAKAFYHPELSFDELNHINFDWYAPANAHRQTPAEVRAWCDEAGLEVEREHVENAGITVIARKRYPA
jgi:SAM-dependent methyltransferase